MTKNKENIFDEAFGYANFRKSIKASTSHYHRIASISKVFTRAAITKLIDEGYF
jgi:CubicO group peptidase (beta-lactamase class C family)